MFFYDLAQAFIRDGLTAIQTQRYQTVKGNDSSSNIRVIQTLSRQIHQIQIHQLNEGGIMEKFTIGHLLEHYITDSHAHQGVY